jgi:outer membrane murein-binding lipoprotein Lpp
MRMIKTYANGRFFDTLNKKYLTKEELASLIEKKEQIKIVMHKTGRDMTRSIISQMSPTLGHGKERPLNIDTIKNWAAKRVDQQVEKALRLINLPTKDQIDKLTQQIEKLTNQVDALQSRVEKRAAKPKQATPEPTQAELTKEELAEMLQNER